MTQKIIKVGNSAAVTIPRSFMKEAGWRVGDKVVVKGNSKKGMLLIQKELRQWLDKITDEHKDLLEELARV